MVADSRFDRPVFIVAAPRSGSTLLFEVLTQSPSFCTIGGESHHIFEGIPALRPGAPGIDSNRLTDASATPAICESIRARFFELLRNRKGAPPTVGGKGFRMLEKTPKNSLRIPFLTATFPDALFIYLYRDPRENVSSIMEAWRSGRFVTYRTLPGWDGPWSLLLPPEWQQQRGNTLAQAAAFQWTSANTHILNDLAALPRDRWVSVSYRELVDQPLETARRLCEFCDARLDVKMKATLANKLPLSRYTLTPPSQNKWHNNAAEIAPVLEEVLAVHERVVATALTNPATAAVTSSSTKSKVGRNDPCPCGSGRKYKHCHGLPS
jgi:LPS sulfotransferase NodH